MTYSYEVCFPEYFEEAYSDGYLWHSYDRRLQLLISKIRDGGSLRVVEVGCGFGHDLLWAAIAGAKTVGIDVNSDFVDNARRTKIQIEQHVGHAVEADIRRTNLLQMSGRGIRSDLYEGRVPSFAATRRDCCKTCRAMGARGQIVIVEPNAWNPLIQFQMFRIRGFNTIIEKADTASGERFLFGNERLVTGGSLRRVFAAAGVRGQSSYIRSCQPSSAADTGW